MTFVCLIVSDKLTYRMTTDVLTISQKPLSTANDGCLENAPDTAEFSREFQLNQHLFDPEHDYPGLGKWVSASSVAGSFPFDLLELVIPEMNSMHGDGEEKLFRS